MPLLEYHQQLPEDAPILSDGVLYAYEPVFDTDFNTTTLISQLWGKEAPIMERVIQCESNNRQFVDGKVLVSPTHDYGLTQINEATWDSRAKELGLDYKGSVEDNIRMAYEVYKVQSFTAWTCYNSFISKR